MLDSSSLWLARRRTFARFARRNAFRSGGSPCRSGVVRDADWYDSLTVDVGRQAAVVTEGLA